MRFSNQNIRTAHWRWMLPILLLAVFLGAQGLNADVVWIDELTSIGHAGGLTGPFSPVDVLESVRDISPKHTPLFFELTAGWAALVGWHHAALRALPLFFGVIALAWIYRIGRDFAGWRVGLWASLFLGLNVFWLEYWHEIRMYSLQFMLIMALLWHYLHLTQARSAVGWHHWLGLILTAALSLYTQPFSIFVLAAIGIYHLFFVPRGQRWLQVVCAFLAAGILYIPWLPVTAVGLTTKLDTFGEMALGEAAAVFARLLTNGSGFLILIPLAAAAAQMRHRLHRLRLKPFWLLAVLILALLLLTNEIIGLIPLRRARYFLISWGLWALVIGSGLAWIRRWWLAAAVILIYLGSGFVLRDAEDYAGYQGTISVVDSYPPLAEYVTALRGKTSQHDYVVGFTDTNFVNRIGKREHGLSTADYYMERLLGIDGAFIPTTYSAERLEVDIPAKLDNHPYLLFTYNPQQKPQIFDLARAIIERGYRACDTALDETQLFARRYVYHTLTCEREYKPIRYDNGIAIADRFADWRPQRDAVRVTVGWEVEDKRLLDEYNVSLQIHTAEGQNTGRQIDRHLYDDILKWHVAELPTDGLPPGDYRVMVIVYNRATGKKVSGADLTSGESGTMMPITVFSISE